MQEILRLQWQRAPDYKIDPVHSSSTLAAGSRGSRVLTGQPPAANYVRVRGPIASYSITGSTGATKARTGTGLDVLLDLANAKQTREGALEFARKWGPPTAVPTLSEFLTRIRRADIALSLAIIGDRSTFYSYLGGVARPSSSVTIEDGVVYRNCETLSAFCWLELLACMDRGVEFRRCHVCGDVYAGKRAGRRSGAQAPKLCGKPACRRAWNASHPKSNSHRIDVSGERRAQPD